VSSLIKLFRAGQLVTILFCVCVCCDRRYLGKICYIPKRLVLWIDVKSASVCNVVIGWRVTCRNVLHKLTSYEFVSRLILQFKYVEQGSLNFTIDLCLLVVEF